MIRIFNIHDPICATCEYWIEKDKNIGFQSKQYGASWIKQWRIQHRIIGRGIMNNIRKGISGAIFTPYKVPRCVLIPRENCQDRIFHNTLRCFIIYHLSIITA